MSQAHIYDMVVIGGGPAGCSAALYAVRAGMDIVMIEKMSVGGQMALTHQIDNYPGFENGIDGFELAQKMHRQIKKMGVRVESAEAVDVSLNENIKHIRTERKAFECWSVVIATGASPKKLGIADENRLLGRGVSYCAACDGMFYKDKVVAVIGGGNTAVTDALLLSHIARKVIMIHRRNTFRAEKVNHERLFHADNVEIWWDSVVDTFLFDDIVTGVRIKNVHTQKLTEIFCDGVFICIGRKPETEFLQHQIELNQDGFIVAGETTQTNLAGVFAAGDVRTKRVRQIVTAVADGAVAIHMAEAYLAEIPLRSHEVEL